MSKPRKEPKPISPKVKSLNEQLARKRGIRSLKKRFLIVCEDTKSSLAYFDTLRVYLALDATSVKVAHSGGKTQPIQVVNEAIRLKEQSASDESGTVPFSQVWCVIDGDSGPKINNARTSAESHDIQLAISTKCFEYWILLHFEENDSSTMDCDALVIALRKKHIPNYDKGKTSHQDIVKNVILACRRAEKLRQPGIERGEMPENQNPCSEVYKLVNAIRDES